MPACAWADLPDRFGPEFDAVLCTGNSLAHAPSPRAPAGPPWPASPGSSSPGGTAHPRHPGLVGRPRRAAAIATTTRWSSAGTAAGATRHFDWRVPERFGDPIVPRAHPGRPRRRTRRTRSHTVTFRPFTTDELVADLEASRVRGHRRPPGPRRRPAGRSPPGERRSHPARVTPEPAHHARWRHGLRHLAQLTAHPRPQARRSDHLRRQGPGHQLPAHRADAPARGRTQRPHRPPRRRRLRRGGHLRWADRHPHRRPPGRGRPEVHPLPHHRALCADPSGPADRPEPPLRRHGRHHRARHRGPRLQLGAARHRRPRWPTPCA